MTGVLIGFLIYQRDQIHFRHLLKGFQAHGTKSSDEYRKLIALIRETQTAHLYPVSTTSKTSHQVPYSSFNPHINPCSKRFYLPTCPIFHYNELIFDFDNVSTNLFSDINTFEKVCQLEWTLRSRYADCLQSTNETCCQQVGPVSLLFGDTFSDSAQCENLTQTQLEDFQSQWLLCNSTLCSNHRLHHYLKYVSSSSILKIYLHIEHSNQLLHFYNYFQTSNQALSLVHVNFNQHNEQILFKHLLHRYLPFLYITIIIYILCLLLFVKNLFFVFIIIVHIFQALVFTFVIYIYVFNFPMTVLNYTSITLYLFIILIDSFLWYACWFVNNHRRDDCTINRIIENLLTQIFYYCVPKNLTAIIILIITYTNQIIALQCFSIFAILLIIISLFISFILYPVSLIFILRYKSSIPTIEQFLHRLLTTTKLNCFVDRTVSFLIIRLKAFWLTSLSLIACVAFVIVFQWPKLQFNVCRITFDTLPCHFASNKILPTMKSLDIDITYYIGSRWEVPNESMIPNRDIPILDYNTENKLPITSGTFHTFENALETNLTQLMEFCSQLNVDRKRQHYEYKPNERRLSYRHYHRHINTNESSPDATNLSKRVTHFPLTINHVHCFGDLSSSLLNYSSSSSTKLSSVISQHENSSLNCSSICSQNQTRNAYECIICLNSLYYHSNSHDDLFLIKNGLRFISDSQNARYLLQTINYKWDILTDVNNYVEWKILNEILKTNEIGKFFTKIFPHMNFWWSSEIFSTYTIMEQLEQEKYVLTGIKFTIILLFLVLFTGVLGIFVTLTTLFNFLTSIAIFTLMKYKLTVEHMSYFTIGLIICSQYSILYSISYKLAPTFFFQRENRTIYSLKQLCTTLFHLTFSICFISAPCLCSSLQYFSKTAMIYTVSSMISVIYSTFFLQSLLCYLGPSGHTCFFIPCRLKFSRHLTLQIHNGKDLSLRKSSTNSRRHQRMSTSSYFASSYFSQIFTGSTYFESEYGGINDTLTIGSRRRESSRSHQLSHLIKRNSILTGELIELYTPRASLAPYGHHLHHHRYSRQSSVPRGVPTTGPARPLYVSPSVSPYSQLSIHSQANSRQRSPSPHTCRPSRSPSPHSLAQHSATTSPTRSLRLCYSAPRLHATQQRPLTSTSKQTDAVTEETPILTPQLRKKTVMIIHRQDAISSTEEYEQLPAANKRDILKSTTVESSGGVWLKRSNSS
ncbi:unnamed protein product [Adineta ricciae]|uniref:SSD domain-containing protein n=1 Tax=Adineta ricciae TaxID=249248 RepID=A0A815N4Z9_ADIRI|nr:unnamed protein product [Adineta ricciae]